MTPTSAPFDYAAFAANLATVEAKLDPRIALRMNAEAKRSQATSANRERKSEAHKTLLASVDGDRECLKTIKLWVPRKTTQKLMVRAYDKAKLFATGDAFHDECYEIEATEYDLEEIEVERARHPDEEVAFAKLQNRYREQKASILGFFHKPTMQCGDRRQRRVMPAPLGDFEWADRSEELTREQQLNHSLAKMRASRPIRNVREAC